MGSPNVLDFDKLLAPIPGDNPCGEDIRADLSPTSLYQAIRFARRAAGDAERQLAKSEDPSAPGAPDPTSSWRVVSTKGIEVLVGKSKDLEIATWMIEALVRSDGFVGLRDGLRLVRELSEQYWDQLFPLPSDDEGLLPRVGKLRGLNGEDSPGTLIQPMRTTPLFQSDDGAVVTLVVHEEAMSLASLDDEKREARIAEGALTVDKIESIASGMVEQLRQTRDDLREALDELDKLSQILESRCGNDAEGNPVAPQTGYISSTLKSCLDIVEPLCREAEAPSDDSSAEESQSSENSGESDSDTASAASGGSSASSGGMTREKAFKQMLELAKYFKKTEPHSPLGWTLEHWVKLGRMDLPQLMTALPMSDEGTRKTLATFVGIPMPEAGEEQQS